MNEQPAPLHPPANSAPGDCAGSILFTGLIFWIMIIVPTQIGIMFLASSYLGPAMARAPLYLAIFQFIALALPAFPLAIWYRNQLFTPIFRLVALAVGFSLLLLPVRFIQPIQTQFQAVLHLLLVGLFTALLWFYLRRREGPPAQPAAGAEMGAAILVSGAAMAAWLAFGALGSVLDTFIGLFFAMVLGLAAALLLDWLLIRPLVEAGLSLGRVLLGALTTPIILILIASALGSPHGGIQILLSLVWGGVGAAAFSLGSLARMRSRNPVPALALLLGLSAAGPLLLFDPSELTLLLAVTPGEVFGWALRAAGLALLVFLSSSLVSLIFLALTLSIGQKAKPARRGLSRLLAVSGVLAWLGAAGLYLWVGQPGFYGDKLFIILEDQADMSLATPAADPLSLRRSVHAALIGHAQITQADLRSLLDRLGLEYTPFYLQNSIEAEGEQLLGPLLALRPDVNRVLVSQRLRPLPAHPDAAQGDAAPPAGSNWNQTVINAHQVWDELGITGRGILIGQSDSGVEWDHPELQANYRGREGSHSGYWLDAWYNASQPYDPIGHGTFTLAIAVGQQVGIAPEAEWIGCANMIRSLGNPGAYLTCMQFMLAPYHQEADPFLDSDPALGAHISTNSWGCPPLEGCDPDTLAAAVQNLRAAGVFFVVAAGNDGPVCGSLASPPAIYPGAFTIGSIDAQENLSFFSSRGPDAFPDLLAPGEDILSAFPGRSYTIQMGTSAAAPHVAGVVALMWSANPALIGDIAATETILYETARPYRGSQDTCGSRQVPNVSSGYGIVDAYAAVQRALELNNLNAP